MYSLYIMCVHAQKHELLSVRVQNAGLGGLRHNTVVMGWPYGWRHSEDEQSYRVFLGKLCAVAIESKQYNMPSDRVRLHGLR